MPTQQFIYAIAVTLLFCVAVWGGFRICDWAKFPDPIRWIVGVFFLFLLIYIVLGYASMLGVAPLHGPVFHR